jgi:hypothetical protein
MHIWIIIKKTKKNQTYCLEDTKKILNTFWLLVHRKSYKGTVTMVHILASETYLCLI